MTAPITTPTTADQPINPNDAPPGCIAVEPPVQHRCTGCKYAPGTTCTLGGFECGRKSRADRRNVIFIDAPTPTTQPAPAPTPPPAPAPLHSVDMRYFDLLHRLGCNSHDGAIQEIANLRRAAGLEKSGTIPTPPPARPPTCSSCRFWDTSSYLPEALNFAPCHRHPPRVNFDFPSTYPTSWCGEHRERQ